MAKKRIGGVAEIVCVSVILAGFFSLVALSLSMPICVGKGGDVEEEIPLLAYSVTSFRLSILNKSTVVD